MSFKDGSGGHLNDEDVSTTIISSSSDAPPKPEITTFEADPRPTKKASKKSKPRKKKDPSAPKRPLSA
jgi:hypothetical protein